MVLVHATFISDIHISHYTQLESIHIFLCIKKQKLDFLVVQ